MGGKSKQAKWISELMPVVNSDILYVETFGGAMWNFINNTFVPKCAVYNDMNIYIYNLWCCIKEYDKFLKILKEKNFKLNDKPTFKRIKKTFFSNRECIPPDFNIASEYIYFLSHCFSGDASGTGNMRLNKQGFIPFMKRLENQKFTKRIDLITDIENLSYEKIIEKFDSENTFFYIDPPYWQSENLYSFHSFIKESHFELAEILQNIKGKFLLSYYDYKELSDLYPKSKFNRFKKEYKKSSRPNKKNEKKPITTEVLISNYKNQIDTNLFFE